LRSFFHLQAKSSPGLKNEQKGNSMERESQDVTQRLEAAASLLERTLGWLEERQNALSGEVERISATVEQSRREEELAAKLEAAEKELAELKASAAQTPLRKTMPSSTLDMLAKHGVGEGPVDARTLDAALSSLSIEQRIAVKSQLLRAGAIA
jgi:predicted  nucleic acid-binding Zn-ribbon protein